MDERKKYISWMFEPIGPMANGMLLLRSKQEEIFAVKKTLPEEVLPVYTQLKAAELPVLPRVFAVCEGEKPGTVDVVEEFIAGNTLRALLERSGTLNAAALTNLALDMCEALEWLHSRKPPVIHRDVKPDNIMVSASGRFVLIDFDAARVFDAAASRDTTQLGTHGYAPPEQYGFAQTDMRSDIYALGATLFEASAGRKYENGSRITGPLRRVIRRCLRFDYNKRFRHIGDVRSAVLLAEKGESRKKMLWSAAGGMAAALLAAAALFFFTGKEKAEPREAAPALPPAYTGETAAAENTAQPSPAAEEEIPCTCTMVSDAGEKDTGLLIFPQHAVWNYRKGEEMKIPVEVFCLRDDSTCKAHVHDVETVKEIRLTGWEQTPGDTDGSTVDENTFADGILTVKEPGSYAFAARIGYHGAEQIFNFYVEVIDDVRRDESVRLCACRVVDAQGDPALCGFPFDQHPFFTFAPVEEPITTLPCSMPAVLSFPQDSTLCRAKAHTPQQWTLTLAETEGAALADGEFTVWEPGVYHIAYRGEYNGQTYEGVFEVDASAAKKAQE